MYSVNVNKFMKIIYYKENINLKFFNKHIILFYTIKILALIILLNYNCIIYIHVLSFAYCENIS